MPSAIRVFFRQARIGAEEDSLENDYEQGWGREKAKRIFID